MSKALKNFFARQNVSMENMDELGPYEGEPVTDADLIEEQLDIVEEYEEYEETGELVEEMEDVVVGLEGLIDAMTASMETGGLSNHAAVFAHREANAYLSRIGLESAQCMVSVESFGGAHERLDATQVSVEGLKETLAKVKSGVKEAVQRMLTAQKNFWGELMGGVKKLQGRVAEVRKVLDATKGEAEGEVSIPGGNSLVYGGELSVSGIVKGLNAANKVGGDLFGSYVDNVDKYFKETVAYIDKADSEEVVEKSTKTFKETLYKLVKTHSDEIIGGYRLTVVKEDDEFGTTTTFPEWEQVGGSKPSSTSVEVPTIAELKQIVDGVEAVVKLALSKGDAVTRLVEKQAAYINQIKEERAAKEAESGIPGQLAIREKMIIKLTKELSKDAAKPINKFGSVIFPACRTALQFVETASGKYKEPAADKGNAE